jgi:hypothetical protein
MILSLPPEVIEVKSNTVKMVTLLAVSLLIILSCSACGSPLVNSIFNKDADYDGAVYQNIKLGISLDELKGQVNSAHHTLSTEKRKVDDATWAYDAADDWPLAKVATWRPYFRFASIDGVEKLCEIGGVLPSDGHAKNEVLEVLERKYGSAAGNDAMYYGCAWKVGSNHPTVVRIVPMSGIRGDRALCYSDPGLLKRAEEFGKKEAPGL